MSQSWYTDLDAIQALEKFHQNYARESSGLDAARLQHNQIVVSIRNWLTLRTIRYPNLRLEYGGSAYEGVKVGDALEFDVMVVINGEGLVAEPIADGFVHLKLRSPSLESPHQPYMHNGILSAEKWRNRFLGDLNLFRNENPISPFQVMFRQHGTAAVQMDVIKNGTIWYEVDMVPCFAVGNDLFVAKPTTKDPLRWRFCYSTQEKQKFENIDHPNGCRRKCLRILKAFRIQPGPLQGLTTFHLKTLLLQETNRYPIGMWAQTDLMKRIMDLLLHLKEALDCGVLKNYFNPQVNVLDDLISNSSQRKNIAEWINRIISSKTAFMNFIQ